MISGEWELRFKVNVHGPSLDYIENYLNDCRAKMAHAIAETTKDKKNRVVLLRMVIDTIGPVSEESEIAPKKRRGT